MSNWTSFPTNTYAVAYGVKGFRSAHIRVRLVERLTTQAVDLVNVVTASLADAGTPLTLNFAQCEVEHDMWEAEAHKDGLVVFA